MFDFHYSYISIKDSQVYTPFGVYIYIYIHCVFDSSVISDFLLVFPDAISTSMSIEAKVDIV